MKNLILGAAIAAVTLASLPACAEVMIRAGGDRDGVVVRKHIDNGRHEGWRSHRAECREVRVRTRLANGHVIFKTRRSC